MWTRCRWASVAGCAALVIALGCVGPDDDTSADDDDATGDDDAAAGDDDAADDDDTSAGDDDAAGDDDSGPDEGPNLLLNGGFEEGEGAYPGVGLHWETNDAGAHPDNDALDTAVAYAGAASQRITIDGAWDEGMIRQVTAYGSVSGGHVYRLRAMVRTEGMENPAAWYVLGLWWFDGDTWLAEVKNTEPPDVNYDWSELVIEAEAPANATRAAAVLSAHFDGTAWYDEVVLAEVVAR